MLPTKDTLTELQQELDPQQKRKFDVGLQVCVWGGGRAGGDGSRAEEETGLRKRMGACGHLSIALNGEQSLCMRL